MKRELICISCPRGCTVTVSDETGTLSATGMGCNRGEKYAIAECTNPVRTVTATVRVSNRKDTMVAVKTATPIPKGKMMDVMQILRNMQVQAPVEPDTVLVEDAFGSPIITTQKIV